MVESKEYVLVSACLAGFKCDHRGESNPNPLVVELLKEGKALAVCPELLAGFPIPRPPAERRGNRVATIAGEDVTEQFKFGAAKILAIAQKLGCKKAFLKSLSPSCGVGKIYDGTFTGKLVPGNGVTADLLIKNGIEVKTEEEI